MNIKTIVFSLLCALLLFPIVCGAEEALLPTPSSSPLPINDTFTKTVVTGDSIKIQTGNVTNNVVVYMEKDRNVYHMYHCKSYREQSGGDYSRPEWLGNVVMDATRCTECISDDEYHMYREAVYRSREKTYQNTLEEYERVIVWMLGCLILCVGISVGLLIYEIFKREK